MMHSSLVASLVLEVFPQQDNFSYLASVLVENSSQCRTTFKTIFLTKKESKCLHKYVKEKHQFHGDNTYY